MSYNENILLKGLNSEQKRAVLHDKGPLLILAGAGSGKTRVITHRIAYLVQEKNVKPYNILAITFTNKAAREMKDRIQGLLGEDVNNIWVGTFHAMLVKILRKHSDKIGFESSFTIMDSDDQQKIVKKCLKEIGLDEKMYQPRNVHAMISNAKNSLIGPDEFAKTAAGNFRKEQIAEIYRRYQKHLKDNQAVDFDDILFYAVELLQNNKDILNFYQNKFEYILVDEYQDTNHAQYTLVEMLARSHQNLCVVGDDDQSIYSFRGANIQNILDFEKDFKNCEVIKLEQNYRSTKTVLDAANCVIANNQGRKEKKLWTDSNEGEKITFLRSYDHNYEARYIAGEIKRLVAISNKSTYNEIAILYRINALSRTFESELMKQGIPYKVYGGQRFFDRKEIKDILAYLRLIVNGDNISFSRIINVPKRGIGNVSVELVAGIASENNINMLEVCKNAKDIPELSRVWHKLYSFYELISNLKAAIDENKLSFADLFEYVQDETGIVQEIIDQREKKGEEIDRVENLKELISDALEFEKQIEYDRQRQEELVDDEFDESITTPKTLLEKLTRYLENTALYTEMDNEEQGIDFVKLMTIHSAKGLEFDYVFMVGAEESIFPGSRSINSGDPKDLEEERRLAYVSITRARKKLYITTAQNRMLFGQTQCLPISRFVKEIPECYLEEISGASDNDSLNGFISRGTKKNNATTSTGFVQYNMDKKDSFGFQQVKNEFVSGSANKSNEKSEYLTPEEIKVGDIVKHQKFGTGKIKNVERIANDAILDIVFDKFGDKKLMTKQAKLKK